jgi:hypothetical protein
LRVPSCKEPPTAPTGRFAVPLRSEPTPPGFVHCAATSVLSQPRMPKRCS